MAQAEGQDDEGKGITKRKQTDVYSRFFYYFYIIWEFTCIIDFPGAHKDHEDMLELAEVQRAIM